MQSMCFQCVLVTHEWLLNSTLRNLQKNVWHAATMHTMKRW